jgi:hypothetical protein
MELRRHLCGNFIDGYLVGTKTSALERGVITPPTKGEYSVKL